MEELTDDELRDHLGRLVVEAHNRMMRSEEIICEQRELNKTFELLVQEDAMNHKLLVCVRDQVSAVRRELESRVAGPVATYENSNEE